MHARCTAALVVSMRPMLYVCSLNVSLFLVAAIAIRRHSHCLPICCPLDSLCIINVVSDSISKSDIIVVVDFAVEGTNLGSVRSAGSWCAVPEP